jgi:hypothetical protein
VAAGSGEETFGCERCWPSSVEAAVVAKGELVIEERLIDESHFDAAIRACSHCGQRFVSIFTETIDWEKGEDPQYWILMPLTADEARALVENQDALSEATLNALPSTRRSLQSDYPKGAARSHQFWGRGVWVGPHD